MHDINSSVQTMILDNNSSSTSMYHNPLIPLRKVKNGMDIFQTE